MSETILVVGGTGRLGRPVAEQLRVDGYRVRILTRDAEAAAERFGEGFEIVSGNTTDTESLESAMSGCAGVHINLRGEAELTGAVNIAASASEAGIRRISYISGATVCQEDRWFNMIDRKYRAEEAIADSGVSYCIFRPTWFMEILPHFVVGDRASMIGRNHGSYHFLAADDYARMVSRSYREDGAANKRLTIFGPEALSVQDAIGRYLGKLHPGAKGLTFLPTGFVRFLATVTFRKGLKDLVRHMSYFERTGETGDPSEANTILGAPQTTLDDWIRKRAEEILGLPADD